MSAAQDRTGAAPGATDSDAVDPATLPRVTYANAGADFAAIHALLDREIAAFRSTRLGGTFTNLIGGAGDDAGQRYLVRSPIDSAVVVGSLVAADSDAVDRAVRAARAARGDWRRLGWQRRIAMLRRAADAIRRDRFAIAMGLIHEVGKSRLEAIGEVEESIDLITFYCDEAERNDGWTRPLRAGSATEAGIDLLRPYGTFAVISPFNFPLALAVGMNTAALLAGNTVVWKPSPGAAFSAPALAAAYRDAGLPDGVFNVVAGGGDVGQTLIAHPDIDGVAFTGSHDVGMSIGRRMLAGAFARPVLAELGGKNAAFVTTSADLDAAASGIVRAAFGLSGQKCSSCSKVYVAREHERDLLERLATLAARLVVGDPTRADVFTGPVVDAAAGERFDAACAAVRAAGEIVVGGNRLTSAPLDRGVYVAPTVVAGMASDHPVNRRELFVPFVSVIGYDALDEAIGDANRSSLGLTSGIYCRDDDELAMYYDRIEAGVLYVNRASGATTGAWPGYQTFCGWKGSGTTGKGGLGTWYVPQFLREQSRTVAR